MPRPYETQNSKLYEEGTIPKLDANPLPVRRAGAGEPRPHIAEPGAAAPAGRERRKPGALPGAGGGARPDRHGRGLDRSPAPDGPIAGGEQETPHRPRLGHR